MIVMGLAKAFDKVPHIRAINRNANKNVKFIQRNIKTKTKSYERLHITHWSAPRWSMQPLFGIPTLRVEYSSWRKYNVGQHAGLLAVLTTGHVSLPAIVDQLG